MGNAFVSLKLDRRSLTTRHDPDVAAWPKAEHPGKGGKNLGTKGGERRPLSGESTLCKWRPENLRGQLAMSIKPSS